MLTYCAMVQPPEARDTSRPTIRAELFSVERVDEHGRSLAEAQELTGRLGRLRRIAATYGQR